MTPPTRLESQSPRRTTATPLWPSVPTMGLPRPQPFVVINMQRLSREAGRCRGSGGPSLNHSAVSPHNSSLLKLRHYSGLCKRNSFAKYPPRQGPQSPGLRRLNTQSPTKPSAPLFDGLGPGVWMRSVHLFLVAFKFSFFFIMAGFVFSFSSFFLG